MKLRSKIGIFFFLLVIPSAARAAEDPDELYRLGRFAEAEKAYEQADMDHPKDIRYRYNRGCAAFQKEDYQGAGAAFASVLKRTGDGEMRFRAAFNLGNSAYKLGDFRSAAAAYKEAVSADPSNEDVRYNLELALRALEREKQDKKKDQGGESQSQDQPGSEQQGTRGDQQKPGKAGDKSQDQDQKGEKDESRTEEQKAPDGQGTEKADQGERTRQEKPRDLSGELKPLQALPETGEGNQEKGTALSGIDRKKAEALLDNIKEDRSRLLRFQVSKEKRGGVASGKDW